MNKLSGCEEFQFLFYLAFWGFLANYLNLLFPLSNYITIKNIYVFPSWSSFLSLRHGLFYIVLILIGIFILKLLELFCYQESVTRFLCYQGITAFSMIFNNRSTFQASEKPINGSCNYQVIKSQKNNLKIFFETCDSFFIL